MASASTLEHIELLCVRLYLPASSTEFEQDFWKIVLDKKCLMNCMPRNIIYMLSLSASFSHRHRRTEKEEDEELLHTSRKKESYQVIFDKSPTCTYPSYMLIVFRFRP